MEYPYFKGLEADRYSFYRVPKALVKADLFQKMSGDAKLLYAVLLDRMSLSIKNGWQDKHGNAYIICTIEEVMDSIHCARQKAVKLLDELEQEFRLIERRRQGLGKPNLLYVKDLYAGLSQSNYWKYENHTSGGMKTELPGVPKSNGSNTEKINKTDNSETDLIYPAELQEEEQYRRYFKEALELEILEQGYPADKAVLYEILELLVETVTSRKKFLRICGEEKPKEVVKSRLMKLDSSHIQYILECLKENSTQIRNIFFNHFLRFCFFQSLVCSGQECHIARLNVVQQSQQFAPAHLGAADGTDDLAILFLFLCCPDGSQPFFQFRDLLFGLFGFIQIFL